MGAIAVRLADCRGAGEFDELSWVRFVPHPSPLPQAGEGMIRWCDLLNRGLERLLLPLAGEGWDEGLSARCRMRFDPVIGDLLPRTHPHIFMLLNVIEEALQATEFPRTSQ